MMVHHFHRCTNDVVIISLHLQTTESSADVEAHGYTQPMIVYNKAKKSASLMADGSLHFQMKLEEAVPTLLASFYVFNIKFTDYCSNLFYC